MPKALEISATDPGKVKGEQVRKASSATIKVQTGDTAKESIELFGDEAVHSNANANWVVTLQSGVRRMLVGGKSQEEIQKEIGTSKMGVSRARTADPTSAIKAKWKTWSDEDRAKFIKELKST